jgi:hypothetical protein
MKDVTLWYEAFNRTVRMSRSRQTPKRPTAR